MTAEVLILLPHSLYGCIGVRLIIMINSLGTREYRLRVSIEAVERQARFLSRSLVGFP
jgi:hypothetical protein